MTEKLKIKLDTIARTIVMTLALLNQILAITGKGTIDIAENNIYQIVSLVATVIVTIMVWWKNNSFTQNAMQQDEVLKVAKARKEEPRYDLTDIK